MKPFIQNHQFNVIRKQAAILQRTCQTVADPLVTESVRFDAEARIMEMFPAAGELQRRVLEKISTVRTAEDFRQYLNDLKPYRESFPEVTEKQLRKWFRKSGKLKMPDLSQMDRTCLTYLGWTDPSTRKFYIVYPLNGELVGVEAKFSPANRKNVCSLCNEPGEVAFVSARSGKRPAGSSPDYYRAVGNYICSDSRGCNSKITDVTGLERFLENVIG